MCLVKVGFVYFALNLMARRSSQRNEHMLVKPYIATEFEKFYGGRLQNAIFDIVTGIPTHQLSLVYDTTVGSSDPDAIKGSQLRGGGFTASGSLEAVQRVHTNRFLDQRFVTTILKHLIYSGIAMSSYNVTTVDQQDEYFIYLTNVIENHQDYVALHFCTEQMSEHMLIQIYENKLIRSNVIYMFYWGRKKMYRYFVRNMHETMRIVLITNPREDAIYYNQATSYKKHHLEMYNWWIGHKGLFHHPTLPKTLNIFKNFHQRVIDVPVLHKPPWYFVHYTNDSLEVLGGRDDKLLMLLSKKLNFRYQYVDPPERLQGSSFNVNGTFEGVLGLLWEKEAEFFIGDVALTQERFRVAEFSFLTLADSGAFITHAPSKLNEALALIRPFNWQVWPAIIVTVILSGPVLYLLIALPNSWYPQMIIKDHARLLIDCSWYGLGLFFKQSSKAPSESHKCRFFIVILCVSATYVIGDMYAANLTSLLARPGREKPINNLAQLEEAMSLRGYKLLVEKHSSSYSLLENGTGIYGRLWEHMTLNVKDTNKYLVDSVERGVKKVRDATNVALMAGRETLFFDIQRFGSQYFHLSEKLNTAYSAIALQRGCPYKENFDKILMAIFEAGILTKMTQDEYENLGRQQLNDPKDEEEEEVKTKSDQDGANRKKTTEDQEKLQPINIRMLQGAFYLLGIGNLSAGLVFGMEILYHRHERLHRRNKKRLTICAKIKRRVTYWTLRAVNVVRRKFREVMNDAIIATLEYTE